DFRKLCEVFFRLRKDRLLVEVIEPSCHFASELQVRQLIFPHRDEIRLVEENIGSLENGIAEETVGTEVLFLDLFLFFFVRRNASEPGDWTYQREQQVREGMFRDARLEESR